MSKSIKSRIACVAIAISLCFGAACVSNAQTASFYSVSTVEREALAKVVYGEARGCEKMEQAAIVWCILNRVDSKDPAFPDTIAKVIVQPGQFYSRVPDYPVEDDILALVNDIVDDWEIGLDDDRVLPEEYVFYVGDGAHNHFRKEIGSSLEWDWSLPNPYED